MKTTNRDVPHLREENPVRNLRHLLGQDLPPLLDRSGTNILPHYIVKLLVSVGHLILCISGEGNPRFEDANKILIHFSNIECSLKFTSSSVHEHVECGQTT